MDKLEKKHIILGVFLIIVGILFLLNSFNILSINSVLIVLGLGFIGYNILSENSLILYMGIGLFSIGTISMVNNLRLINIDIRLFSYLLIIGIVLIYMYFKRYNGILLLIGNSIVAFGVNSLINNIFIDLPFGIIFLLLSLGFFVTYFVSFRINGVIWPKYLGYLSLGIGLIFLAFNINLFKVFYLRYLIPIGIIGFGGKIIYDNMRSLN